MTSIILTVLYCRLGFDNVLLRAEIQDKSNL